MKKNKFKVTKLSKQDISDLFLQYIADSKKSAFDPKTRNLEMAVRSMNLQRSE